MSRPDSQGLAERRIFVAGATGYTGRHLVEIARAQGMNVIAHVRPDSNALPTWEERFERIGATVDTSAWTHDAISAALTRHAPTHVYALLGTTRARAREDRGSAVPETYEAVDVGLTLMLLEGAAALTVGPRFVYLSSVGVTPTARGAYLAARARVEARLAQSPLPHLIARPGVITGDDRDEDRPGERWGARVMDTVTTTAAALGFKGPQQTYRTMNGQQLAAGLLACTLTADADDRHAHVVDAGTLYATGASLIGS